MSDKYILEGKTVVPTDDLLVWAKMFEDSEARTVAKTTVGNADVSKVFLGLNHSYGNGPPLIFETLVFGGQLDQEMDRYSTWDEAERGHKAMVGRVEQEGRP